MQRKSLIRAFLALVMFSVCLSGISFPAEADTGGWVVNFDPSKPHPLGVTDPVILQVPGTASPGTVDPAATWWNGKLSHHWDGNTWDISIIHGGHHWVSQREFITPCSNNARVDVWITTSYDNSRTVIVPGDTESDTITGVYVELMVFQCSTGYRFRPGYADIVGVNYDTGVGNGARHNPAEHHCYQNCGFYTEAGPAGSYLEWFDSYGANDPHHRGPYWQPYVKWKVVANNRTFENLGWSPAERLID